MTTNTIRVQFQHANRTVIADVATTEGKSEYVKGMTVAETGEVLTCELLDYVPAYKKAMMFAQLQLIA